MNAFEHYQSGNLLDAVASALEEVKRSPLDHGKRGFLCELLCLTGDLERADKQLEVLGGQHPLTMPGTSLFRQLIRAEQARQQFYTEARLPEFLNQGITTELGTHLEAAVLLRDGKPTEAAELLADFEQRRPRRNGICNGQPFEDFRDLDDLTASFFEVLTSTGKYYWIPFERIESVEFRPWTQPRDLLWRRAHMSVRDGPDGEIFLPVLYTGSASDSNDMVRLGRATEWRGEPGSPIRGFGQRTFLVGSEDRPILDLQTISISLHRTG
jgi:type VI secretion system protein ImpE